MEGPESTSLIDPQIFESLQTRLDEESKVREELNDICQKLERDVSSVQGRLSRVHATPRSNHGTLLQHVEEAIRVVIETVGKLSQLASNYPYHKFQAKWAGHMTDAIVTVLLTGWLGGMATPSRPGQQGRLMTLEDVGEVFQVPVHLKEEDAFHITLEEYLTALTKMTDELSRLAMNSVTLGDYELAVQISRFVKDVHAGFQMLNLKNNSLRKSVDGVKYHVKKVEDIVYDLSLRNLIPTSEKAAETAA